MTLKEVGVIDWGKMKEGEGGERAFEFGSGEEAVVHVPSMILTITLPWDNDAAGRR